MAMIGICAAAYAVVGRLTDLGITFGGVAFWPAAVIPAIFAVLFGPWIGGIGAGIGIFIRDMLFHGNPLLSLSAGVPPNFIEFALIGYVSRLNFDWRKLALSAVIAGTVIIGGFLLPTVLLPSESVSFTQFSTSQTIVIFVVTIVVSLLAIGIASKLWKEWKTFVIGSVIGQGIGSLVLAISVWTYSQFFYSSNGYFRTPIPSVFIPLLFIWTFATEIPFILLIGPPVIRACYKAFPSLRNPKTPKKGKAIAQNF